MTAAQNEHCISVGRTYFLLLKGWRFKIVHASKQDQPRPYLPPDKMKIAGTSLLCRLIQPHQVHARFGVRLPHEFFRAPLIVFSYAYAQPVSAVRAAELEHLGGVVTV